MKACYKGKKKEKMFRKLKAGEVVRLDCARSNSLDGLRFICELKGEIYAFDLNGVLQAYSILTTERYTPVNGCFVIDEDE